MHLPNLSMQKLKHLDLNLEVSETYPFSYIDWLKFMRDFIKSPESLLDPLNCQKNFTIKKTVSK